MNEQEERLEQLAAVEKDLREQLAKSKRNERLLEDRIKTLQGLHERLEKETEARKLLEAENQRLTLEIEHTRSVPRVVRTLSGGESVLGITLLNRELFVLRQRDKDQLTVYEASNYGLLRRQTLKGLGTNGWNDMASCDQNSCLYITDHQNTCVHRIEPKLQPDVATKWLVNDKPSGVTVTQDHNLLVACIDVRKLKEFTTHGEQLREISLDSDIVHPWHAVKSTCGRLVVCHGIGNSDPEHRVCAVDTNDNRTEPVEISQLKWPRHLAIDRDDFIFVADCFNDRVVLLSPDLRFVRIVIARELQYPHRLFLDSSQMRLYIGDAVQVTVLEL